MRTVLAGARHESLWETRTSSANLQEALQSLKAHLAGILVLTDMRSPYFAGRFPIHQWHMSGKVQAIQGTFTNSKFQDTYAQQRLACLPACYRIRPCFRPYSVINRSIDFWAEELHSNESEVVITEEEASNGRLQALAEGTGPNSVHASSFAVVSSRARADEEYLMEGIAGNHSPETISSSSEVACVFIEQESGGIADKVQTECMVCLSRPPTLVFEVCGHYGVCGPCRKWMCKEQFNRRKSEQCRVSPAALKMKKVAKVAIMCPYCRKVTRAVHHSEYTGTTYSV